MRAHKKKTAPLFRALFALIGVAIFLFFVAPLLWALSMSLKTIPEIFAPKIVLWPAVPQFGNYARVLQSTTILLNLKNSAIITVFSVALVLLLSLPSAFALSRLRFRGKTAWMFLILVFQMLSPVVVAIPLYRFFLAVGIYNKLWSLILVYVAAFSPFTVWYLKGYFDTVPAVLDEAAKLDGATRLQALLDVHIPVAAPGIASVTILLVVQCWSQFVLPLILLDDKNLLPVPVGLLSLQSTTDAITTHYLAAASLIGILPVLVCFVVFQRFIVSALTAGAVKE